MTSMTSYTIYSIDRVITSCDHYRSLSLHLTYQPLSVFRFQMYVAISNRNNWWETFGQQDDQSDEEQDTLKVIS